jgi:hypothetical protein
MKIDAVMEQEEVDILPFFLLFVFFLQMSIKHIIMKQATLMLKHS